MTVSPAEFVTSAWTRFPSRPTTGPEYEPETPTGSNVTRLSVIATPPSAALAPERELEHAVDRATGDVAADRDPDVAEAVRVAGQCGPSSPSNELGMVVRTATGLGAADAAVLRKIDVGVPARAAQPG